MDTARWKRIEWIFDQAVEKPANERSQYLDEACGPDVALRSEVVSLLDAAEDSGATSPVVEISVGDALPFSGSSMIGQRIGHYLITSEIASGGMGVVFEAMQEQPRRVVALKIVRPDMSSHQALRRFQYESQVLAGLRHPNIAQVYEAGIHDDGQGGVPYFAMEYIPEAKNLAEVAAAANLKVRDRLKLFAKICDAIHHGHQRGIIHRDIKPANILVDAAGEPKVIDFGIAKATDSDMTITQQTDVGQLVGTMQYMSPEQCDGDPNNLDTRSDVYSLGMILYELLSGKRAYETGRSTIYQATTTIKEAQPQPLSTFGRQFRGDLETIAAKALEKEPARRYQSAQALKEDIERHLNGEPINARKATRWMRTTRWMGRHPAATALVGASVVGMIIVAAALGFVWYGNNQPADFWVSADAKTARLVSPFGSTLATLGGEGCKPDNVQAMLVDRPSGYGGGQVAMFVVLSGERSTGQQLWVCDPDNLDDPIWRTQSDTPYSPPVYPPAWNGEVMANDFVVRQFLVANVFEDTPENEIVIVHGHTVDSPWVVRVYNFAGEVLFEAWHVGYISTVYWWAETGQLVCTGDRHGTPDISQHGFERHVWPRVVFALCPRRGLQAGWLNEPGWPQAWRSDSNISGVLAWYKTLLPRSVAKQAGAGNALFAIDRVGGEPLLGVNFESTKLGGFHVRVNSKGEKRGFVGNDPYMNALEQDPHPEPYVDDWPPSDVD